jgi:hypothetical protein
VRAVAILISILPKQDLNKKAQNIKKNGGNTESENI